MPAPMYEALEKVFIEPEALAPGSIFTTTAPPSPTWLPLNEEAKAMLEAWYDEEIPFRDKEGELVFEMDENGKRVQKMYKPHAQYRPARASTPGERHELVVLEGPPVGSGSQDLGIAGVNVPDRKSTDQRPGPAPRRSIAGNTIGVEGEATIISKVEPKVKVSA